MLGKVDAAHWWGVFGWLYRNTPGNLAASAIAFTAGYMVKGKRILRGLHEKLDAHDEKLTAIHEKVGGTETR